MPSFLDVGTATGPPRPPIPVARGWGVGVFGKAETAGCGAVVVACRVSTERRARLCCLCLEASVWLFLASVWEAMAAEEREEDTRSDRVVINMWRRWSSLRGRVGRKLHHLKKSPPCAWSKPCTSEFKPRSVCCSCSYMFILRSLSRFLPGCLDCFSGGLISITSCFSMAEWR